MHQITYKKLSCGEIDKLGDIVRTEIIDHVYSVRDDELVLDAEHHDVPRWSEAETQRRIAGLQKVFDQGATFYGAFDGARLVGMSVLDHTPVRSGNDRLNLEGLWVSHGYRGQGIGRTLFQLAADAARARNAKTMYVSATPSENTVRFYTRLGCTRAAPIDAYLFEKEPEDIHLELSLAEL